MCLGVLVTLDALLMVFPQIYSSTGKLHGDTADSRNIADAAFKALKK